MDIPSNIKANKKHRQERRVRRSAFFFKKISWPAIFAGALISLVALVVFNLLAIGTANSVENISQGEYVSTVQLGWWAGSTLLAALIGGIMAGRFSFSTSSIYYWFHGLLSWCVFTFVTVWLLMSPAGAIVSSNGRQIVQLVYSSAFDVESNKAIVYKEEESFTISLSELNKEVEESLGKSESEEKRKRVRIGARQNMQNTNYISREEVDAIVEETFFKNNKPVKKVNKEKLYQEIRERTNLSEEEAFIVAHTILKEFEETEEGRKQKSMESKEMMKRLKEAKQKAASWSLATLLLGSVLSSAGGRFGKRFKKNIS